MSQKKLYNLTTNFLLPLTGWKRSLFEPYLIGAYIGHDGIDAFDKDGNYVYLLLKWSADEKFQKITETISNGPNHISEYDPDQSGFLVMHVFRLSREFDKDYDLYIEGKYSQMSDKAKLLIRQSCEPGGVTSQILNKDPRLRMWTESIIGEPLSNEDEVWSSIQDEHIIGNEIFSEELLEKVLEEA